MNTLNLPAFDYKVKQAGKDNLIFDELRRKYVVLTPEEWVRQHFVNYLLHSLHYPKGLISIERAATYNKLQKRTDIRVFDNTGQPHLLVECKAAHIPITQEVIKQVSTYNQTVRAKFVVITNGIAHYCWQVDFQTRQFSPLQQIPAFMS